MRVHSSRRRWTCAGILPILLALGGAGVEAAPEGHGSPPALEDGAGRFHAADTQLEALLSEMLESHPELAAARRALAAGEAWVEGERALPGLNVGYRFYASSPETRVGPQRHALEVSQSLPWFGIRELRRERARRSVDGEGWSVRALERELGAGLKRAYFEAAYAQSALAINSQERDLLRRFEKIALTRYATGEGIQQSVVKVQTELTRLADREIRLGERLAILEQRIAGLAGRADVPQLLATIELRPVPVRASHPAGLPSFTEHPRILASSSRVGAREAEAREWRLRGRPEFSFGIGWTEVGRRDDAAGRMSPPEDNGRDALALMVGVQIPLDRRGVSAGISRSEEEILAGRLVVEATVDRLEGDLREASLRLHSSGERSLLYKDVLIPQAQESLASAEAAYTTGKLQFLDLLEAQRVLFEVRLSYQRLLADGWIALTDMELGLGRAWPEGDGHDG